MDLCSSKRQVGLLALCGLGLTLIAGAALLRFPLLASYKIQILTLEGQISNAAYLGPALVLGAGLAFCCYVAGFGAVRAVGATPVYRPLLLALVLLPPLICALLLLFIHPTTSLDLYDYLYRGHMAARYEVNNFIQTPETLRRLDRLYWYTAWRQATTAYGPLWELLSVAVARLAGPGLFGLTLGFKLVALAGWLFVAGAIAVAGRPGERLMGLFLWLWNPLVLWELVGAGHNDGWMLVWLILALACLKRWPVLALLLVTTGALFKYSAALLWPLLLAAAVAATPGWHRRISLVVGAGLCSAVLVVLAYLPWWAGVEMLDQIRNRGELFTSSPLSLLYAFYRERMPKEQLQATLNQLGLALLALGVLVASWLAGRRPQAVAPIGVALLLWFLSACTPWFQPWYLSWPIGLLALRPRATPALWALGAMSLGALLTYPAFAALRPFLDWPAQAAPWQALIVTLIYMPPLLSLALWRRSRLPAPVIAAPQQEVA